MNDKIKTINELKIFIQGRFDLVDDRLAKLEIKQSNGKGIAAMLGAFTGALVSTFFAIFRGGK